MSLNESIDSSKMEEKPNLEKTVPQQITLSRLDRKEELLMLLKKLVL